MRAALCLLAMSLALAGCDMPGQSRALTMQQQMDALRACAAAGLDGLPRIGQDFNLHEYVHKVECVPRREPQPSETLPPLTPERCARLAAMLEEVGRLDRAGSMSSDIRDGLEWPREVWLERCQ